MKVLRMVKVVALLALVVGLLWSSPAHAHAAPHSLVLLDMKAHEVEAELRLPVSEIEAAWRRPLAGEQADIVREEESALRTYVAANLHATSRDGAPWTVTLGALDYRVDDEIPFVVVHARLAPLDGADAQVLVLEDDVLTREVMSHTAWVAVRSDFANGLIHGADENGGTVVGVIRSMRKTLLVDRSGGGNWRGFRGVFQLGMRHIAEGTDHLLFLLALLLPAPLLLERRGARGERRLWGGYAGLRPSVGRLLRVVTAFTLGHSITLLSGAVGWLRLPGQPVEVLIAVSILVSAVHAVRPIFPGREGWVAAGFGLVHGMAFAGALSDLRLDPSRLVLAVLGFNLGIEAMQLLVIACVAPWLLVLARTPAYRVFRIAGALFAGAAAIGWIGQRAAGLPDPLDPVVTSLATHPLALVATLASCALIAALAHAWKNVIRQSRTGKRDARSSMVSVVGCPDRTG